MSTPDRIAEIQAELAEGSLSPLVAREALIQLTAYYASCSQAFTAADLLYKSVLRDCLVRHETAAQARIMAEGSSEYRQLREAQDAQRSALELIRSVKAYMRSMEEEQRLAGR